MTLDTSRERDALEAFEALLDIPEEDRPARLAELERQDPELASRARALLAAHGDAADMPTAPPKPLAEGPLAQPEQVGPFRIVKTIGEGGMGAVYRAERNDGRFEQAVAIKTIRTHRAAAFARDRFGFERQALARLVHPNIARLYDGGETADGAPYFVMELIEGRHITGYCTAHDLSVEAIARLFLDLCGAVQFAHQQLLVHADIKPANVLVTDAGAVKLVDFGVARYLTHEAKAGEAYPLSRLYAAPELLAGGQPTIAADVFSLGLLLAELLTETPPDREAPPSQRLQGETATARDAVWRRRRAERVRGDLDAIVAKAAAPDPAGRYASAAALAEDISRHLAVQPVAARGADSLYALRKFARRRRWPVTAAAAALVALIAGTVVTSTLWVRAEAQRRLAEQRFDQVRRLARTMLFDVDDSMASVPGAANARYLLVDTARRYLDGLAAESGAPLGVRLEAGQGYQRIGEILGAPQGSNLGRPKEAISQLARAEAILAPLHAERPKDPEVTRALADTLVARGAIAVTAEGDAPGGLKRIEQACAMLDAAGGSERIALSRLRCGVARAVATNWDGRYRPAAAALARDLAAAPRGRTADWALLRARGQYVLGDAFYYAEDRRAALGAYRGAIAELAPLDAQARGGAVSLDLEAVARWRIGATTLELGDPGAALGELERADALASLLAAHNPDNRTRRMRQVIRLAKARTLSALARHDEAIGAAKADIEDRRREYLAAPGDAERVRDYAVAERVLGDLAAAARRKAETCTAYGEADRAWTELGRRGALPAADRDDEVKFVKGLLTKAGCAA